MTAGANSPKVGAPVLTELPFAVEPGDPVDIHLRPYIYDRTDPDGAVTFRSPGPSGGEFLVADADGHPRKPICEEVGTLMAAGDLVWRAKPLQTDARRFAREQERSAAQVIKIDPKAEFRTAMLRRWDDSPTSKSDRALEAFVARAMSDPKISDLPGAWRPCGATLREWIEVRGRRGERRMRDGMSMRGRMPRERKVKHPVEILFYHLTTTVSTRGDVQAGHDRYRAEITNINAGVQPNRRKVVQGDNGKWTLGGEPAVYPRPATSYIAISYSTFWRRAIELKGEKSYGLKTTVLAAEARYGGGGVNATPTHLGALCSMDDTPVPNLFLVDDATGIPMGPATLTVMREHKSKANVGWDLSADHASTGTVLRTVRHANLPKTVPEDLLAIDPGLTWIRLRPDRILFDNLSAHHGISVEHALADAYISCTFAAAKHPRAKASTERLVGTFLDLLFKRLPDANYDIARMRLYGFDPDTQVLCTIGAARKLLDRAAMTLNVTGSRKGLDGRQPGLVWKQELGRRKPNVIEDLDQFELSMGSVEMDITLTNAGVELFNRRYSDHQTVRDLIQDYERGWRKSDLDPNAKRRREGDDRKRLKFTGKCKYDPDDIGRIHFWNEHGSPKRWVTLPCTDASAHGMPLWLHKQCLALAQREAMEYCTPAQQAVVRARLFEEIADVTAASSERQRRTLAKALDDSNTRRVFGQIVGIVDERVAEETALDAAAPDPELAPDTAVGSELSTGSRNDGFDRLPRPKWTPPREAGAMPRRQPRDTSASGQPRAGSRPSPHDSRDAGTPRRRSETPEATPAPPARLPSSRLKWGDEL